MNDTQLLTAKFPDLESINSMCTCAAIGKTISLTGEHLWHPQHPSQSPET